MTFNYDAKEARDVGLSCRFHLSNSQVVSSVENNTGENNFLVIVCKFVYLLLLLFCFCFFVLYCFLRDILLHTYVVEAVGFSGLSIIPMNLWKTLTMRDIANRGGSDSVRHFSLEQTRYLSLLLPLSGFHSA